MSAISSFALDCAQAGRWVRGLMALHGHLHSTDTATRQACVAIAQVAAPHSWAAALSLLHPSDVTHNTQAVCKIIDTVARHPHLSVSSYEAAVETMLRTLSHQENTLSDKTRSISTERSPSTTPFASASGVVSARPSASTHIALQRRLFLSATRWCSPSTARRLLAALSQPPPHGCVERVHALRTLHHCILHDVGPFAQWAAAATTTNTADSQIRIGGSHEAHLQQQPQQQQSPQRESTRTNQRLKNENNAFSQVEGTPSGNSSPALSSSSSSSTSPLSLLDKLPLESMSEMLLQLDASSASARRRHYTARDLRERAKLKELRRQSRLAQAHAAEAALRREAAQSVAPSQLAICAALRFITRPHAPTSPAAAATADAHTSTQPKSTEATHESTVLFPVASAAAGMLSKRDLSGSTEAGDLFADPAAVLSLVESSRLTPEVGLLYARAVGLLCPERWEAALECLARVEGHQEADSPNICASSQTDGADASCEVNSVLLRQVRLWLMSQGSWAAALQELRQMLNSTTSAHTTRGTSLKSTATASTTTKAKAATATPVEMTELKKMALDMVRRTALPAHEFYRLLPQHTRPWYRLTTHQTDDVDNSRRNKKKSYTCNSSSSNSSAASADAQASAIPISRLIARALARGVRLDEIQLSPAGKEWAAQGRWEKALHLYYRFPLPEFQKYAARSLVKAQPALPPVEQRRHPRQQQQQQQQQHLPAHMRVRQAVKSEAKEAEGKQGGTSTSAFDVLTALQLLVPPRGIQYSPDTPTRPAPPLETFPAALLIEHAPDWATALAVFRGCIRGGTRCNAQLLSALLHKTDFPPQELRQVLTSYPTAVNDGVRRRAKESFNLELP